MESTPLVSVIMLCRLLSLFIKPWASVCSKGCFCGLIFGGAYWKEFCVSNWVGLDNKNSLKHYENSLKKIKTASSNSPWAYIGGGGGGGGAYYRKDFCV